MVTELLSLHTIFLQSFPSLQEVSGVYDLLKMALRARNVFSAFEKQAPGSGVILSNPSGK